MKDREKSFLLNGGILLEDLIASSNGKCNPIRNFSPEELIRATGDFNSSHIIQICPLLPDAIVVDEVDDHSFSHYVMYRGSLEDRQIIVKKFTRVFEEEKLGQNAIRDIVIATQMSSHKNVLKLIGCCLEFPVPVLVHEYAANGPLNEEGGFGDEKFLPWKIRLRIAKELAYALTYLHTALSRPVIHRDIRPSCIFLDHNFAPKFCNFALSITIPPHESRASDDVKRTFGYSDPNYLHSGSVTEKSDVYSFGVLFLVFLTGQSVRVYSFGTAYETQLKRLRDHVQNDRVTEIVDPKILREGGGDGQRQQLEAFLALALACTQEGAEARPEMIDVAKELRRIEKCI